MAVTPDLVSDKLLSPRPCAVLTTPCVNTTPVTGRWGGTGDTPTTTAPFQCYRPYKFRSDFPDGTVGTAGYGLTYIGDPNKGGVGKPQGVGGGVKVGVALCLR